MKVACSALFMLIAVVSSAANAQAPGRDASFRATFYGWFPTVSGETTHTNSGGGGATLDASDYLDSLRFTFMGALEAREGRYGLLTDFIYLDFDAEKGGTRDLTLSGPAGIVALPADASASVNMRLRGWAWTLVGTYSLVQTPQYEMQFLGGLRYLKVDNRVDWRLTGNVGSLPPAVLVGASTDKPDVWDAVVGARGRYQFGDGYRWFVPYYVDVGTGQSDLTWQALIGVGYAFSWGEVSAVYRHLDYDFDEGSRTKDLSFSGPAVGLSFRW